MWELLEENSLTKRSLPSYGITISKEIRIFSKTIQSLRRKPKEWDYSIGSSTNPWSYLFTNHSMPQNSRNLTQRHTNNFLGRYTQQPTSTNKARRSVWRTSSKGSPWTLYLSKKQGLIAGIHSFLMAITIRRKTMHSLSTRSMSWKKMFLNSSKQNSKTSSFLIRIQYTFWRNATYS